jgi:hypothetical protein
VSYDDDWGVSPHRHLPLPYEWDVEEPTDDVRTLVREVLDEHPGHVNSPSRVAAHLRRHRNVEPRLAQIAGALVEMGGQPGGAR